MTDPTAIARELLAKQYEEGSMMQRLILSGQTPPDYDIAEALAAVEEAHRQGFEEGREASAKKVHETITIAKASPYWSQQEVDVLTMVAAAIRALKLEE